MWMIKRYQKRAFRKPLKYTHPRMVCSNCGANYSKHWLEFIGGETKCLNPLRCGSFAPDYCPNCGYYHGGEVGGDSDGRKGNDSI